MEPVTRYKSINGVCYSTPEEAEQEDFVKKIRDRIRKVFPDNPFSLGVGLSTGDSIARNIEPLLEALGIPFDREKFLAEDDDDGSEET